MKRSGIKKPNTMRRIMAMIICLVLVLALLLPVFMIDAAAAEAGGDLEIRVGYWGDDLDYRTKAVISREELESMSSGPYYYSNVTRVGTVMETVAWGATIYDILNAAGIDPGSVMILNFRTTDREGTVNNWFVSLDMDVWVNQDRFYYPYLRGNYERYEFDDGGGVDDEGGMVEGYIVPLKRSTRGWSYVPAILAVRSYSTKDPNEVIDESMMTDRESYRFCTGQSWIEPEQPCSDYTSMNSAYYIFGIDVTLVGSPGEIRDVDLDLDDEDLVVGSTTQIRVNIDGDEFYEGMGYGSLFWESSDPSVADVDQEGVVTIYGEGRVTITVTAQNGISRSVTINCVPPGSGGDEGGDITPGPPDGGEEGGEDPSEPSDGEEGGEERDDPSGPSEDGKEDSDDQSGPSEDDKESEESKEDPSDGEQESEESKAPENENKDPGENSDPGGDDNDPGQGGSDQSNNGQNTQEEQNDRNDIIRPQNNGQTASINLASDNDNNDRNEENDPKPEEKPPGEEEDPEMSEDDDSPDGNEDVAVAGTKKKGMKIFSKPHSEGTGNQDEYTIEIDATALDAQQRMPHAGLLSALCFGFFAATGGVGRLVRFRKETV